MAMAMLKRGDWFRLEKGNDWGYDYWSRAPKLPGSWGTCSSKRQYKLSEGDELRVRLLDGSERVGVVGFESRQQTVGDHGKHYTVTSEHPRVKFPDGTFCELGNVELQYDPDRDPTAAEMVGEEGGT